MKKYFCIIMILTAGFLFAGQGDSYEPEIMNATSDAPVMLYLKGMDAGFTAIKSNMLKQLEIKSTDKKEIKLISLYSMNLLEAIDENNKVLTYKISEFELLKEGIQNINIILKNGKIDFEQLLDSIEGKFISRKNSGNKNLQTPISLKNFVVLMCLI